MLGETERVRMTGVSVFLWAKYVLYVLFKRIYIYYDVTGCSLLSTENRVQIRATLYLPQKRPCGASDVQMDKDTMNGPERLTGGILCQPERIRQGSAVPDGARCPGSRIAGMSGRFPGALL